MTVPAHAFPPPPRRLRRRAGWAKIIFLRGFVTPALIAIVSFMIFSATVAKFGKPAQGTVDEVYNKTFSNGTSTRFVRFTYTQDAQERHDEQRVAGPLLNLTPGTIVSVRTANILGFRYATLADGLSEWLDLYIYPLVVTITAVFIGAAVIARLGWHLPGREKKLMRNGEAFLGHVTFVSLLPGRLINYEFEVDAVTYEGRGDFAGRLDEMPRVGDIVHVFCDRSKPSRNVAYECANFEVEPGAV